MILKKIFVGIFNFIKKIYLWLFNFMIGNVTMKFYRFFVHVVMIVLLFIYLPAYINGLVHIFQSENPLINYLETIAFATLAPVIIACGVKVMMLIESSKGK